MRKLLLLLVAAVSLAPMGPSAFREVGDDPVGPRAFREVRTQTERTLDVTPAISGDAPYLKVPHGFHEILGVAQGAVAEFSVVVHFKHNAADPPDFQQLFMVESDVSHPDNRNQDAGFHVYQELNSLTAFIPSGKARSAVLNNWDEWHCAAIRYEKDASDGFNVRVAGEGGGFPIISTSFISDDDFDAAVALGYLGYLGYTWDGQINDLSIWAPPVLTNSEVDEACAGFATGVPPNLGAHSRAPDLRALWRWNSLQTIDGTGIVVKDRSGNGFDALLITGDGDIQVQETQ